MSKRFGYTGKSWSCLWCGLKFKEGTSKLVVSKTPAAEMLMYQVGAEFEIDGRPRKVKSISFQSYRLTTGKTGRGKWVEVGFSDQADQMVVKWDPPKLPELPIGHYSGEDDATKQEVPLFCGKGCAAEFGRRMGELGKRLVSKPQGEEQK